MKTAREWFETFPEPYRSQALENSRWPDDLYDDALDALALDFVWRHSPQKHKYWTDFYKKLELENQ